MSKAKFRVLTVAVVGLLLLGSLVRCGPTEAPTPEPTERLEVIEAEPTKIPTLEPTEPPPIEVGPEPTEALTPQPAEPTPGVSIGCTWVDRERALARLETDPYTIRGQIIVTGPAWAVEEVVQKVQEAMPGLELEPLRTCDVWVPSREGLDPDLPRYFPAELVGIPLRMDLYEVAPDQRDAALGLLNEEGQKSNAEGEKYHVVADPNYITSLQGQSMCGQPHTVVGSPHTVVGSPHTVVGSPGGTPLSLADAEELFWNQWAWGQTELGPELPPPLGGQAGTSTGAGIRVGVLDTAPFAQTGPATIDWMSPSWTLNVSLTAVPALPVGADMPPSINDHGLFVAGLIHGAAPESDIHLVQVLDEHGCGALYDLATQVYTFTEQVEQDWDSLSGAVLNLSLGVPITHGVVITTLEQPMLAAVDAGIVVVAAAGNDSYAIEGEPLEAQLPAAYGPVIGVAASNASGSRACFSNKGDVDAPGGEGGGNQALIAAEPALAGMDCLPMVDQCAGPCDYALISLGLTPTKAYYYWSGTSFSTPLVSGLAALVLQAGHVAGVSMAPDAVFGAIECAIPQGSDLINAPGTLSNCIPTPTP
jgi:hypothetical protein